MPDVRQLGALALVIVVAAFIISVGGTMLTELQDSFLNTHYAVGTCDDNGNVSACGSGYNASVAGLEGITTFSTWIPLIALVIVLSIVIGIIVRYMGGASDGM